MVQNISATEFQGLKNTQEQLARIALRQLNHVTTSNRVSVKLSHAMMVQYQTYIPVKPFFKSFITHRVQLELNVKFILSNLCNTE